MMLLRLVLCLVLAAVALAAPLEHASFLPPYAEVDSAGDRMINKHWRTSGATEVMKNFIRLTPDRQSKRGSVWTRTKIGSDAIVINVKFRIAGQGKTFFGDGIALWLSDSAFWSEGDLHGGQADFTGLAVVLDTFKNTENLAAHRDVSVMINDGKKTVDHLKATIEGCNTSPTVRYHSERADFQVTDASRAQIHVYQNKLHIKIDARNTGEWVECISMDTSALSAVNPKWISSSYLGVSASTGQLADNHDVISVEVDTDLSGEDSKVMTEKASADAAKGQGLAVKLPDKVLYEVTPNEPVETRLKKIESTLNNILVRLAKMDMELEHTGVTAMEKINNIVGKLSKREDVSESRIEEIEHLVKRAVGDHIDMHLEDRLSDHSEQLRLSVQDTVTDVADHVDRTHALMSKEKETLYDHLRYTRELIEGPKFQNLGKDEGAWKIPFVLITLVIIAALGAFYQFRQTLLKKHFL